MPKSSSTPKLIPSFRATTILFTIQSLITFLTKLISISWKWITTIIPFPSNHHHPTPPPLHIAPCLRFDPKSTQAASVDFGRMVSFPPAAVFHPFTVNDIVSLIEFSYSLPSSVAFTIAARGCGHSLRGQAMAERGVVVEMSGLNNHDKNNSRIRVYSNMRRSSCCCDGGNPNTNIVCGCGGGGKSDDDYVDVGGEQLWIDVLLASLEYGLAPVSWTDYLYLSVGGTLSNAGISGQSFRHGPQIINVLELDVVTGKGKLVTCSREMNSELFYAVLGGLGQFGIITRARIPLHPAPKKVKWVRMLYDDFTKFTRDQEHLISGQFSTGGLNYVEGSLVMPRDNSPNNWRSSFFSESDQWKITSLPIPETGIIYCLEIAIYHDYYHRNHHHPINNIDDNELELIVEGLGFLPGFIFVKDVSFMEFLNRVREGEVELQSKGLWEVPHPWLNLFVPRSRISDFNDGAFLNIIAKQQQGLLSSGDDDNDKAAAPTSGPILVYPMNRSRWDNRMSAMITEDEDEVFYTVGLLHSSGLNDWQNLEEMNRQILKFCEEKGIQIKQYLAHCYDSNNKQEFWRNHFGSKWKVFNERKQLFDPKMILSPGQKIFN